MSRQSRQGRMNARYWQNEVQKAQLFIEEEHWDFHDKIFETVKKQMKGLII